MIIEKINIDLFILELMRWFKNKFEINFRIVRLLQ